MDDEIQDFIHDITKDMVSDTFLDQIKKTWNKLVSKADKNFFEAFIAGNLSGALLFFYSSFEGKKVSNLSEEEMKDLNQWIINYYAGIRPKIIQYIEKQ
jgi:hypothetical protein